MFCTKKEILSKVFSMFPVDLYNSNEKKAPNTHTHTHTLHTYAFTFMLKPHFKYFKADISNFSHKFLGLQVTKSLCLYSHFFL